MAVPAITLHVVKAVMTMEEERFRLENISNALLHQQHFNQFTNAWASDF
jgi:hypothetical protein